MLSTGDFSRVESLPKGVTKNVGVQKSKTGSYKSCLPSLKLQKIDQMNLAHLIVVR